MRSGSRDLNLKPFCSAPQNSAKLCLFCPPRSSSTRTAITFCRAVTKLLLSSDTSWLFSPGSCCPVTTHVCISWVVCASVGVGGRAHCKGTGSSLFDAGSPAAASRLCGLHQPLPPGHRLGQIPQVGAYPAPAQRGGEEAAETGFPGLTEQWPGGLPLTHIPKWLLSKEVLSLVASRWTGGSPLMCKHTCSQTHIPPPTITHNQFHIHVCACIHIIYIYIYVMHTHHLYCSHLSSSLEGLKSSLIE